MARRWDGPADLVHAHNPLLKKNRHLLGALRILKDRGIPLLIQTHDFAEEFRPDLYDSGPYIEDVHYAVVNGRDYSFLRRSGLEPEGIHLLPPAVAPVAPRDDLERTRYLYPVRANRRKNLGEALLLSLFIPEGRPVAVSLPPAASRDASSYGRGKACASRMALPVEFDVGEQSTLSELFGSSVCAVSTSQNEGFGFSFLEPWTADRVVVGRRIDHLCRDFERAGVSFEGLLYDSIDVPMVYLPAPLLRHKLEAALFLTYKSFSIEPPPYAAKVLVDDLFSRSGFDFGRLGDDMQMEMLETLAANAAARADLAESNPFLSSLGDAGSSTDAIQVNKERILAAYSLPPALMRLKAAYRNVVGHPVRHRISKGVLLELFLDPLKLPIVGPVGD